MYLSPIVWSFLLVWYFDVFLLLKIKLRNWNFLSLLNNMDSYLKILFKYYIFNLCLQILAWKFHYNTLNIILLTISKYICNVVYCSKSCRLRSDWSISSKSTPWPETNCRRRLRSILRNFSGHIRMYIESRLYILIFKFMRCVLRWPIY